MTEEAPAFKGSGKAFDGHGSVSHSADEYVRKVFYHTQNVESFFATLTRDLFGSFHAISEQHLQRFVEKFSFRRNTRSALGIGDAERTRLWYGVEWQAVNLPKSPQRRVRLNRRRADK